MASLAHYLMTRREPRPKRHFVVAPSAIGSVIACPEAPFGTRLARRFEDAPDQARVYRHWLRCAAATGDGLMVPMGFEFAASEDMDDRQTANAGFASIGAARNLDMTAEIGEANALPSRAAGKIRYAYRHAGQEAVMPRGPQSERRLGDLNAKIARGEIGDVTTDDGKNAAAVALGRMGGKARAAGMSAERRQQIAKKAAKARWSV